MMRGSLANGVVVCDDLAVQGGHFVMRVDGVSFCYLGGSFLGMVLLDIFVGNIYGVSVITGVMNLKYGFLLSLNLLHISPSLLMGETLKLAPPLIGG